MLISNKISKLLKRYLNFKLPIRTQLVKSLCKRYVVGEDRGGGSPGVGGAQEEREERMGGLAGEIYTDLC